MEKPIRLHPTTDTLRALFAKSGNQCAFPGCSHPLVDQENRFVAQVCHIEDALEGGRFNPNMSNEERRHYDNLLLLCYMHHIVTNDTKIYTVDKLKEIKHTHEAKNQDSFKVNEETLINIFSDIKSIKEDTSEIKENVSEILKRGNESSQILKQILKSVNDPKLSGIEDFIKSVLKLENSNAFNSAIMLLERFKTDKWEILSSIEKVVILKHLGTSYLEVGNNDKASNIFIETLEYAPEDESALGMAAIGFVMCNDGERAASCIETALSINPLNINANIAFINLEHKNLSFEEILKKVPSKLHNTSEISFAFGLLARSRGDFTTSITWLQKSVDETVKNKSDLQTALASTILESITIPFQIFTGQIDIETQNKITYSIHLLTDSWNEYKNTDVAQTRLHILVNRALAKRYLNDLNGALEDLKIAISIDENYYFAYKQLAIMSFETKNYEYALELAQELKSLNSEEYAFHDLFIAHVYYAKKEFQQTAIILENLINNAKIAFNEKDEAQSMLIFTYLALGNFEKANQISKLVIESNPDHIRGYINASKIATKLNDKELAITLLRTAYDKIGADAKPEHIRELAYQLYQYEEFPLAISALKRITNRSIYSELSKNLIHALFRGGMHREALDLCHALKLKYGPIDFLTEVQSAIYESIDDLPNAIATCKDYLKIYPDDQWIQIRLALIYRRIKDDNKVILILDKLIILGELPVDVQFQLSHLNISYGRFNTGLNLAFNARNSNFYSGIAHLKYVGILLEFQSSLEHLRVLTQVENNSVVKIKDESGNILIYKIVTNIDYPQKDELLITDSLAQIIIGKGVGFTFKTNRGFGAYQSFEIVEILNQYIYAFQESLELLNNKFIDVEGFKMFHLNINGNPVDEMSPVLKLIDESIKIDNQLNEFYRDRFITIGAFAQIKKQNPIRMWN